MTRYITREGAEAISDEIDHLWKVERPDVVDQVREAADLGDRSENAAYIYGKKRLRAIDSRLRYLRKKLQGVVVVDPADQVQLDYVQFAAVVTVLDDNDQERTWRLVDKEESDPKRNRISVQSPIGRALMRKCVGDYVEVQLPKGKMGYEVLAIRYGPGEP
jgi:transcription elongation factor GreB